MDKKSYEPELVDLIEKSNHFLCISNFFNEFDWIGKLDKSKYIIYNKSKKKIKNNQNTVKTKNVGYNLHSYLLFIIENYENLPESTIFCKDNIFSRHISVELFKKLVFRKAFTSLEDNKRSKLFPFSVNLSDNSFNEINTSWYKNKYDRKYFSNFNEFYKFVFKVKDAPTFLKFCPGANYIVPRDNILIRSKLFYKNLLKFISYSQFSCESHFLERSLCTIWNSNIESSDIMNSIMDEINISLLISKCNNNITKENIFLEKSKRYLLYFLGRLYFKIIKYFI